MKKFLSIILIFFMMLMAVVNSQNSLIKILCEDGFDFEICELNNGYQVVEIFDKKIDDILLKLNAEIVDKKIVADRVVVEAYVSSLDNYVVAKNRKVNIQISATGNNLIVGYPLIKNSF